MNFVEDAIIVGTRKRSDGYLVVDARVARTGIQKYLGTEVGKPELDTVSVFRPPDEVFADETMKSFAHIPVTDDHPKVMVTAENWKEHSRGQTADEIRQEGKFIRVPLMVADGATITKIEGGKRELSAGYTCELVWKDGVTEDGEAYQAVQTKIRANHVAVVQRGRAGKEVRIGDSDTANWGAAPITVADTKGDIMSDTLRKVMVDGLSVNTTDEGAQAISKLIADRDGLNRKLTDQETAHKTALDAKDAELAKKDAEIDSLKGKVLDQKGIDALVAKRANLEATAAKIAKDVKPAGLSDTELKRAVVTAIKGADSVKDKSEAYVDAAFDILAEDAAQTDPLRDTMRGGLKTNANDIFAERQKAFDGLVHFDQTGKELN